MIINHTPPFRLISSTSAPTFASIAALKSAIHFTRLPHMAYGFQKATPRSQINSSPGLMGATVSTNTYGIERTTTSVNRIFGSRGLVEAAFLPPGFVLTEEETAAAGFDSRLEGLAAVPAAAFFGELEGD